jgi:hypothetical protein
MDQNEKAQHEDAKEPSADRAAAGPTDPTPAAQPSQSAEPKSEIGRIEAPSIVPSAAEPADAAAGKATQPAAKLDEAAPTATVVAAMPGDAAPATATLPIKRASSRLGRAAPLAAAVVVGVVAGALGATALPQIGPLLFGAAPPPAEAPSVTAAIGQVRADLAALKAATETTGRSTGAQFAKLSERLDRLERAQTAAGKADMVVAKESTGATAPPAPPLPAPPPPAAAVPLPPAPVPGIVSGWVVRDVYHGAAILQGRLGGMIEVGPGDILPGVGRIEAIRRQDGHWVVITPKGMIVSMR